MRSSSAATASFLVGNTFTRTLLRRIIERRAKKWLIKSNSEGDLYQVQLKKFQFVVALLHCVCNNLKRGFISKKTIKKLLEVLMVNNSMGVNKERVHLAFQEEYGMLPPLFIVLSPTQRCNLNCKGCYAAASSQTPNSLPYNIARRIISEVHDVFGRRIVTISGGEPFAYRSEGKTMFDLFEEFSDTFFLVYTNGTLIDQSTARVLAQLGNVTPAISVEGFQPETDQRRGKGVYGKITRAFANLREAGMPFGISVTATSENADLLLSEEFYDYYFQEVGATYCWQFQFMPIGRGAETFDLVVPPEKRVALYRQWEKLLIEKKYCTADFWNSGVLSSGCIAYGREKGGYFYIDWNGNIMPCVFVPYYMDNVYDLFAQGKTLADALFSDLFKRGRQWQKEFGLKDRQCAGNWLMPCSIRDHFLNFRTGILTPGTKGEDENAEQALIDEEYIKGMEAYDEELKALTRRIWEEEYPE